MKRSFLIFTCALHVLFCSSLIGQNCYLVDGGTNNLYSVSVLTGELIETSSLSMQNGNVSGFFGLARNPVDGVIYALINEGNGIRSFGWINLETNEVVQIGQVSYIFESMQFTNDGLCYAMTASNDDTPSRLVNIDITNGEVSILADFSEGDGFSQALVFDSASGTMHRCYGGGGDGGFGSEFYFWQTIELINNSVVAEEMMFPGLNDTYPWTIAMCYQEENSYLLVDQNVFYDINAQGQFDNERALNFEIEGVSGVLLAEEQVGIRPNPETVVFDIQTTLVQSSLQISNPNHLQFLILDTAGKQYYRSEKSGAFSVNELSPGSYILFVVERGITIRFLKL